MNDGARKPRSHNPITAVFDRLNEDGSAPTLRADSATGSISVPTLADLQKILDGNADTAAKRPHIESIKK